ncbi:nitroreductase family protein [Bacillus weihaiensis]|uniref:Nitroreductase n=1 Tax=Bacillus weihaiensis TaxID=1547283 RepID=A0A1L3MRW8_9BACI|nr:nitroreductase [Bacillus weihaiensis]APH05076.1 nitroreductase [Bacillus weihaiensis]
MSVIEELKNRRAIRDYLEKDVEEEKLNILLDAATWAPNDRMREPWTFYVIKGEAKKRYEKLATDYLQERFPTKPYLVESSLNVLKTTPVHMIITADIVPGDEAATRDNEYAVSCAIHSMWLAARELDLGFVWRTRGVGLVHDERIHTFIGSPENKKVIGNVFIGYPDPIKIENMKQPKRTSYQEKTVWL